MIRKFQPDDTKRVMDIWLNSNIEAHSFVPKDYWISNYSFVQDQLIQANVYIYEQGNIIKGFVGMTDNYMAGIFVDKNFRSMGIGKMLIDYIKGIYPSFNLNVYKENRRAVDFYKREGLNIISEETDMDTQRQEYTMEWKNKA